MWLDRAIALIALAMVSFALYLDVSIRHDPISVDFHTYLAAARVGIQHGWSHLYDQGLVAVQQHVVAPGEREQPFLSPPTVAFLVSPLVALPFHEAYVVWAFVIFGAFAVALALCGVSPGIGRWVSAVGALAPWWVMHAVNVGQVVPLVAAGTVVGWRLLRDRRDGLAGIAFAAILLKPNTAWLVPLALLFGMRYRALASWLATSAVIGALTVAMLGPGGVTAYLDQLRGPLPPGADNVTLHGALEATGWFALALRILIVGAVVAAAYRYRRTPSLAVPLALVGSLLVSPYLHGSDLVVLAAAGWMLWEERPSVAWRTSLAVAWVLASPFLYLAGRGPLLTQWPWLEIALFLAVAIAALRPLTGVADSRRRAPA